MKPRRALHITKSLINTSVILLVSERNSNEANLGLFCVLVSEITVVTMAPNERSLFTDVLTHNETPSGVVHHIKLTPEMVLLHTFKATEI